jgi:enoyl-CoA hydratase
MTSAVTTERRGPALVCHLDDGKANALSKDVIAAIGRAVNEGAHDDAVAAVVVHGRPGRFCAGFDLDVMRGGDPGAVADLVCDGGDLVRAIYAAGVPVVAACTGHALAAGALVLLACDVRVGADIDCKIGLNEVAIGMVLPDWALTLATERLSKRHLQRAVATARVTDGRGAVDAGFLDEVVAEGDVLDRALAVAEELSALDRRAYAGTVRAQRGGVLATLEAQVAADRASGSTP